MLDDDELRPLRVKCDDLLGCCAGNKFRALNNYCANADGKQASERNTKCFWFTSSSKATRADHDATGCCRVASYKAQNKCVAVEDCNICPSIC